jgi:hypothetical protein
MSFLILMPDERLSKTWANVDRGLQEHLKTGSNLFTPIGNFLEYRKMVSDLQTYDPSKPASGIIS